MEKDAGLPSCCGTPLQAQREEQKRERDPRAGQGARGRDFCLCGVNQPLILTLRCGLLGGGSTDTIQWSGADTGGEAGRGAAGRFTRASVQSGALQFSSCASEYFPSCRVNFWENWGFL